MSDSYHEDWNGRHSGPPYGSDTNSDQLNTTSTSGSCNYTSEIMDRKRSLSFTDIGENPYKRQKDNTGGGRTFVDPFFLNIMLPLFNRYGWNYNSQFDELRKGNERLDCHYAVPFILKNPVWIESLKQYSESMIHSSDVMDHQCGLFVSDIANRTILTQQILVRIDYQASVQASSMGLRANNYIDTTPFHDLIQPTGPWEKKILLSKESQSYSDPRNSEFQTVPSVTKLIHDHLGTSKEASEGKSQHDHDSGVEFANGHIIVTLAEEPKTNVPKSSDDQNNQVCNSYILCLESDGQVQVETIEEASNTSCHSNDKSLDDIQMNEDTIGAADDEDYYYSAASSEVITTENVCESSNQIELDTNELSYAGEPNTGDDDNHDIRVVSNSETPIDQGKLIDSLFETGDDEAQTNNSKKEDNFGDHDPKDKRGKTPADDTDKSFVCATKRLPKYIRNEQDVSIKWELDANKLMEKAFASIDTSPSLQSSLLRVLIEDSKSDPYTQILTARGRKDLVNSVYDYVGRSIHKVTCNFNHQKLIDDRQAIEVNVRLNLSEDLGFMVTKGNKGSDGLWVKSLKKDGQLGRILGRAAELGVVLLSIGGEKVDTVKDKQRILDIAKAKGATNKYFQDNTLVFNLCISPTADTRWINVAHLVEYQDKSYFRRRSGGFIACDDSNKLADQGGNPISDYGERSNPVLQNRPPRGYNQFIAKVQTARDLEFLTLKDRKSKANSVMWSCHKRLYGEKCEDDCRCLRDLNALIEKVVDECFEVEYEKQSVVEVSGFISVFVHKFWTKVEKQYPTASPHQVLVLLISMWNAHKSERRFGIRCTRDCKCGEAWTPTFIPVCDETLKLFNSNATISSKVPRKSSGCQSFDLPAAEMLPPKALARRSSDKSVEECETQFSSKFHSTKPLGFYVVTDKSGTPSKCVVKSVSPCAQCTKVRIGSVVYAASQVSAGLPRAVNSCEQLRHLYEAAKRNKGRLQLSFNNSNAVSENHSLSWESEWTDKGAWRHNEVTGWAGGAPVVLLSPTAERPNESDPVLENATTNESRFRPVAGRKTYGHTASLSKLADSNSWGKEETNVTLLSKGPLLLNRASNSHRSSSYKKTTTNVSKPVGQYSAADEDLGKIRTIPACSPQSVVSSSVKPTDNPLWTTVDATSSPVQRAADVNNDLPEERRAHRLLHSITDGSLNDVILALNDGINPDDRISGSENAIDVAKIRNEKLKHRLLKIFCYSRYAIDVARYNDESKCIYFVPGLTEDLELSPVGEALEVPKLLQCSADTYSSDGTAKVVTLYSLPLQDAVDGWTKEGLQNFVCCYNEKVDRIKNRSGRELVVHLEIGNSEKRFEMKKGTMTVKVKQALCPEEYLSRKRKEAADLLTEVVGWIRQFIKESAGEVSDVACRITSGSSDGVALLHAAVYLRNSHLVRRFLSLGCDPHAKSKTVGSPLDLASNLAEKAAKNCDRVSETQFRNIVQLIKAWDKGSMKKTDKNKAEQSVCPSSSGLVGDRYVCPPTNVHTSSVMVNDDCIGNGSVKVTTTTAVVEDTRRPQIHGVVSSSDWTREHLDHRGDKR